MDNMNNIGYLKSKIATHNDSIRRIQNLIKNDVKYHEDQINELYEQMKTICPHTKIMIPFSLRNSSYGICDQCSAKLDSKNYKPANISHGK